ncbi:MAG: hypothetical protein K8L99_08745, partial [Anaerolineae bacterium]|nr:hypothetical protein [Anaerolineae bacterium]
FTDCLTEALEEELPKIPKDQRKEISDELKSYFRRDSVRSELVELALTVGLVMPDHATSLPGAETDLSPVGNTIFQKFIHFLPHHIRVEAQRPNSPLENLVKLADIEAIRISLENLPVQLSRELTRLLDEGTLSEHDSKRSLPGAPPPPPEFVGRDTKLDELEKSLAASRIVGIWGSGGIGKTSLVQAYCAKEEVQQYSVFWAEMTENTEALQILLAWVRFARPNYEINPSITEYQTADEVRVLLTEFIANHSHHHALFIIDNIWENQIDVAQMILRCIPDKCPVMITTRQKTVLSRLQLSTKIIELDVLSDTEVDLLLDQQVKSIYFTPDHRANIKSLLDGHPIALVHAIKTLNQAGDSDDMDLIIHSYHSSFIEGQDIQAELEELYIDSPGLFAVLEYSYNQLGTEAKQCFRLLGILAPNSQWDKQLVEHLWPVSKSGSMIRALHTHALIDRRTDTLYAQHALLRSYALWQLRQCNEVDKAQLYYAESIAKTSVNARDMQLREIQYLVPHIDWVGHILTNRLIELFEEPSEEEQAILIQFTECYLDFT